MVNSVIDKCLKCKKLRGQRQTQKMADLPADRVNLASPYQLCWTRRIRSVANLRKTHERWPRSRQTLGCAVHIII